MCEHNWEHVTNLQNSPILVELNIWNLHITKFLIIFLKILTLYHNVGYSLDYVSIRNNNVEVFCLKLFFLIMKIYWQVIYLSFFIISHFYKELFWQTILHFQVRRNCCYGNTVNMTGVFAFIILNAFFP